MTLRRPGVVTASFGVGWWSVEITGHLTSNQMYAVADNMVYEAKNLGRDRIAAVDAHFAAETNKQVRAVCT